ncbi:MAG: hypothetical protein P1T08_14475 [Acidimicrobiia bacterium]|nr:hypothetical protein [Acidimicrobiia bacterium]
MSWPLDLTREQLELLERQRGGRDLTVIIDPAIHAVSGDRNLTSMTTQTRLTVPALHWAAVLDQARFADAFSLVIPLGDAEAPDPASDRRAEKGTPRSE